MTWYFEENEFSSPGEYQGFVYRITELDTGKMYIGKKNFWKPKILPITKTRKRRKRTIVESDWQKYYGSNSRVKVIASRLWFGCGRDPNLGQVGGNIIDDSCGRGIAFQVNECKVLGMAVFWGHGAHVERG